MPELPEVETVVRELRRQRVEGRRIMRVRVRWARTIAMPSPHRFAGCLQGQRIDRIERRGKYVVMRLSGGLTLLVHLRMTGRLRVTEAYVPHGRHERVELEMDDGRVVRFDDSRKFGRWLLTAEPASILNRLGPEPLARTYRVAAMAAGLRRHRRQIKPLLLDQSFLAGLGNIYADESLWDAAIHPQRRAHTLSPAEVERLYKAVRKVLRSGIAHAGTSLGTGQANFRGAGGDAGRHQASLKVFRRTGRPCPRCGQAIRRAVVAQRGTHFCPECQPRPTSTHG